MTLSPAPPRAEPAAEFERHFQWRWLSMVGFLGFMLLLTVLAILSLVIPPRTLRGVPDDPDARAAYALVGPGVEAGLLELRFDSELGVTSRPDGRVLPGHHELAERAESLLTAALRRHPDDPRLHSAIGHLDLVRQKPRHAERSYRAALDLAPHHDEARLGLGVVLARLAALEADPIVRRRLQLRAIAQFAAVREHAVEQLDARFDRAVLLAEVGRMDDARRWAALYLAADPASAWSELLRRQVAER